MLSSTAEKIYWISRYTERAENTARLVNVNINLLLDIPHDRVSDFIHLVEITSDVEHFNETLLRKKIFYSSDPSAFKELVLEFVIYDTKNPGSIASCIEMTKYNSRYLRTILSKISWEQLNNLHADFSNSNKNVKNSDVLLKLINNSRTFFSTIADAMSRDHVFDFIKLGRFIERADMLSRIIEDQILRKDSRVSKYFRNLQWMCVLKSINGFESFKKINKDELNRANVLDFIIKSNDFPRSIMFCLNRLISVMDYLPRSKDFVEQILVLKKGTKSINKNSTDKDILELIDLFQSALNNLHNDIASQYFLLQDE
ncbi:MAG: hypothetical protein CMD62_00815 [Gammaproteobacteria bacterium]|nr:hypothetical protein [Gammaproteobacteria bacterium]|tara:strand:- start:876 stop:1817 length:942 start_codon:yes stop_codon:yes gene_type:complete